MASNEVPQRMNGRSIGGWGWLLNEKRRKKPPMTDLHLWKFITRLARDHEMFSLKMGKLQRGEVPTPERGCHLYLWKEKKSPREGKEGLFLKIRGDARNVQQLEPVKGAFRYRVILFLIHLTPDTRGERVRKKNLGRSNRSQCRLRAHTN